MHGGGCCRNAFQLAFGQLHPFEPIGVFFLDESSGHFAGHEFWVIHHGAQERQVVADPLDLEAVQRHTHPLDRALTSGCPRAQLRDHRVVIHADLAALIDAGIIANGRLACGRVILPFAIVQQRTSRNFRRWAIAGQTPDGGQEAAIGVFGIEAVLDGPAVDLNVVLRDAQRLAIGDADHLLHQIDAGDQFGHGVFHLKAGVHLEEVEILVTVDDEFDRTGRGVAHCLRQRDRLLAHRLARGLIQKRAWRLFHNLLVAALDRAFTLVQVNPVAMGIAEDLNFDVARLRDKLLDEDPVIAKGIGRLVLRALEALARLLIIPCDAHTLAATARRGLEHHGVADLVGDFHRLVRIRNQAHIAGNGAHACFLGDLFRGDLVAHLFDRAHRGAYECHARSAQCFGEFGVLREETITRMHRLCAAGLHRLHHLVDDDIGLVGRGRADMDRLICHLHMQRLFVRVRIDGDSLDSHLARGLDNAAGNLAAVGDQDLVKHMLVPCGGERGWKNAKHHAGATPRGVHAANLCRAAALLSDQSQATRSA